jgi:ATP-dependent RNA helicase RhlE
VLHGDYLRSMSQVWPEINISSAIRNALQDKGFHTPTPIQEKVFGPIMSGADVCGIAQTGTGKTVAYLVPSLMHWKFSKEKDPQVLIIVPTRELVVQVMETIEFLSTYLSLTAVGVYGGVNLKRHVLELENGADIIVGTPGRVFDLLMSRAFKPKSIKRIVIDEVDEMLAAGFRTQLNSILDLLPSKRQNLLFSATLISEVAQFIQEHFSLVEKVQVEKIGKPLDSIEQMVYQTDNFLTKINVLENLVKENTNQKILVFASTKKLANRVFDTLVERQVDPSIQIIHSNKDQNFRFRALEEFEHGDCKLLIATDILARGIDVDDIAIVVNFDIPDVEENYVHRIGRTGRAGKKGKAVSFCSEKEAEFLEAIEQFIEKTIPAPAEDYSDLITDELLNWEIEKPFQRELNASLPSIDPTAGKAFHEKIAKNKKVNNKITRKEKMQAKYGKPITKGKKR